MAVGLASASLLAVVGALLALCKATRWAYVAQVRKAIMLLSGLYALGFVASAFKYRSTTPDISGILIANAMLLALVTLAALTLLREN
jgi:hypothetical protein